MTKILGDVLACGWSSDPNEVTFGTLQEHGLLTKEYRLEPWDYEGDSATIVWTVVGDIEFTDSLGHSWKKGDVIEWPK